MKYTKKLIEVALPLDAINEASVREKSIRHGHPSTLHLWWARRPLATARAVIFAQMVDDPSEYVDVLLADPKKKRAAERAIQERIAKRAEGGMDGDSEASEETTPTLEDVIAEHERHRLFEIIRALVKWENTTNEAVLQMARDEIWQSWRRACAKNADHPQAAELFNRDKLPGFHDPFAGGGALPLEAQRLGLEAFASDLNPVAVLINKAMIEIPPKFAEKHPINPKFRLLKDNDLSMSLEGIQGLAEDLHYYGNWMQREAKKRIGNLYPRIHITAEMANTREDLKPYVGRKLTVIAWIWARTVASPNPALSNIDVPLVSTFILSKKTGKEAYIEPIIEHHDYRFVVRKGRPKNWALISKGTKISRGSFRCLISNIPIQYEYIDSEANSGKLSERLMAIVAEGDRSRIYLSPTRAMEETARRSKPKWMPNTPSRGTWASNAQGRRYGFHTFGQYFTPRQLVALNTFSDLVKETYQKARSDANQAGLDDDNIPLRMGGSGIRAYVESLTMYLALVLDKCSDYWSSLCSWHNSGEKIRNTFGRQAIPMVWDYAEVNPFCESSGNFIAMLNWLKKSLSSLPNRSLGTAKQANAASQSICKSYLVSTDPPYYDNIGYADLSDFFYSWLRPIMREIFPDLFSTLTVPKRDELVADSYRHNGKTFANEFFLNGMTQALRLLGQNVHPSFPVSIYYAFKQSEAKSDGNISTGWQTFLDATIRAGFGIHGTWPIRTELGNRMVGQGTNALASSIVLICRPKSADAPIATLREFIGVLKSEIRSALIHLGRANIAPVDLAQAAIGLGMSVYTRYSKVLDASGHTVSVRDALALINQSLDEIFTEQEGDCDSDSQWAVAWFDQYGFSSGEYGIAETLSKAKNTSVAGLKEAGILASSGGKIRLLSPGELPSNWNPEKDSRLTAWEIVHHLIRVLETEGEESAGQILRRLGSDAETARELCYRLFTLCERKKRFLDAMPYNRLVKSWPEIVLRARTEFTLQSEKLFDDKK